jgi:hypothetical protein
MREAAPERDGPPPTTRPSESVASLPPPQPDGLGRALRGPKAYDLPTPKARLAANPSAGHEQEDSELAAARRAEEDNRDYRGLPPYESHESHDLVDPLQNVISGRELDEMTFPPLRHFHDDVPVLAGGLVYLSGPPKAAKTYLAYGLALAVAQGSRPFGSNKPVNHSGDVLYISLDDSSKRRARTRLRDMNDGNPLPANLHLLLEADGMGTGGAAAQVLERWMKVHPNTALIVIDTLEALRPQRKGGNSHYSEDVQFLKAFRQFLSNHTDTTLKCLGHTRKGDGEDAITATGGTHGITGGADQILRLEGKRGAPSRTLDIVSRDDEDRSVVLAFGSKNEGLVLTGEDPDDPAIHLTGQDQILYRAVAEFTTPVGANDLRHLNIPNTGDRLIRMTKAGYLSREGRGSYAVI